MPWNPDRDTIPVMQTLLFRFSKLINPLLSPATIGLLVPIIALAAVLKTARLAGKTRALAAGALALLCGLYAASLPAVSNALVRAWEAPRTDPASLRESSSYPFEAIVVLGGSVSVELSEGWHIETGRTTERLTAAARLYHAFAREGHEPLVIATGGSGNPDYQTRAEAPLMRAVLELMGVPPEAVHIEGASRNTYENALYTKEILSDSGLERCLLVTSALHMRRSRAVFEKQGIGFEPFAVDTNLMAVPFPNAFFPDTEALDNTYRVFREVAGFVAYRLMGRL